MSRNIWPKPITGPARKSRDRLSRSNEVARCRYGTEFSHCLLDECNETGGGAPVGGPEAEIALACEELFYQLENDLE
jgi:hypothetical protein